MTAALLRAEGLRVGAYISPHVRGWSERIQVDGADADLDAALARVRPHADGATQFEVLTAAALAEFAGRRVDVAVVEAGLGGRHDATNVLDGRVVVLTNVSLEHTDVLGETREAIAAEKLAVVAPGAIVILGEPEWERPRARGRARPASSSCAGLEPRARASRPPRRSSAAPVDPARGRARCASPAGSSTAPSSPLEIWDGAHNLAGIGYLLPRLPDDDYTVVASILADKHADGDAAGAHAARRHAGRDRLAEPARDRRPRSSPGSPRRISPGSRPSPTRARRSSAPGRIAGPDGAVLVTGSLYLLSALSLDG